MSIESDIAEINAEVAQLSVEDRALFHRLVADLRWLVSGSSRPEVLAFAFMGSELELRLRDAEEQLQKGKPT